MDGVYSSTWFTLRNYERYWNDYGYWVQAILTVTVPMSGVTAYKFIRRFRNV